MTTTTRRKPTQISNSKAVEDAKIAYYEKKDKREEFYKSIVIGVITGFVAIAIFFAIMLGSGYFQYFIDDMVRESLKKELRDK